MNIKYELIYEKGPSGGTLPIYALDDKQAKELAKSNINHGKFDCYVLRKITTEVLDIE